MKIHLTVAFAVICCVGGAVVPGALSAQELSREIAFSVDNDYFNFWIPPRKRSDDNYTNGLRLQWTASAVPSAAGKLLCHERKACGSYFELGQEMYTPTIDAETPLPGQRPYAGWLFGRASLRTADEHNAASIGLVVGLTGRASLAEQVQSIFHREFGFRRPLGWKYQLGSEPAFAITAERSWFIAPKNGARFIDLSPSSAISIGTLRTSVTTGARLRVGSYLEHPWLKGPTKPLISIQLFVGGRQELVARDLFLDGNTFASSIRVDKMWHRAAWDRGVALRAGAFSIEYEIVTQSREYATGPVSHSYSTIGFKWTR